MKKIYVHPDSWALVDDVDWLWLAGYIWCLNVRTERGYAITSIKGRTKYMHKMIADRIGISGQADHHNQIRLDNQRHNLRAATASQNKMNQLVRSDSGTGFKDIHQNPDGRFRVKIAARGKRINIGTFSTIEGAIAAYQREVQNIQGEFGVQYET